MVMVNLNLLFRSLHAALDADDVDSLISLLIELNLSFVPLGKPVDTNAFDRMLDLLDCSTGSGDGAWHVFGWFMSNGTALDDSQIRTLGLRIVELYPKFRNGLILSEVADWVGGWRDREALMAVRAWVSDWKSLSSDAKRGVHVILRDMLDGSPLDLSPDDFAAARSIRDKCEQLMMQDRLGQTSLH
ncbi:MAG: hypothetical protein AMXMBFR59_06440 [Rhodanobacteraceae bacterium]